jgi:ribosomal protein L32
MPLQSNSASQKAIESKARRAARRCGLRVKKSRRAISCDNFGEFALIIPNQNLIFAGSRFDLTAEEIIEYCDKS